ncbi:membrane metallo-endopeptidase-like 1 isoform X2 [Portunus trituberculatus]|uniref:membrane metallo-endopeptidase-like 1 isoform X2 n=1 Tax=Portunus trituberculatus TaxID=210409 RepID=UPI001E1D2143|nr:membrane metallo-endopeptidase-like 1 isoform X2 [Portunus trituberculatus]
MERNTKIKLGILAIVVVCICFIIIVSVVAHPTSNQDTKSKGHEGIIPETPTTPPEIVPNNETINITQNDITTTATSVSQARGMIEMMDSTQEACENFYQYACGGEMSKSYIQARQPGTMARMMIKEELEKQSSSDSSTGAGKMKALYDSCFNSGSQDANKDRAKPIRDLFGVYKFRADKSFIFDLSDALGYMMNKGFMPFFTMELDIDPKNKEAFMLSRHPTVPGSRFTEDLARKVCLERHYTYLQSLGNSSYTVNEEYEKFRKCVGSGDGLEARLVRMKDAVVQLQLMNHLTDEVAEKLLSETISNTRKFLIELSEMQSYLPDLILDLANWNIHSTDYVTDLPNTPINWETVLKKFLNIDYANIETYRVSKYQGLDIVIKVLQDYYELSQQEMNNILVLLWAERIYTDFVKPVETSVGNPEYCLNAAIALMEDTASYLYLQAVAPDIKARNAQIDTIAENIKREALRLMENSTRKEDLQDKLKDMMDNVVKLNKVNEDISTSSMEQVSLNGDFLHNSLVLLAHRSTLTKKFYDEGPSYNYRVFARPYDPSGFYSYPLNRIMIPYAAQEPFHTLNKMPEYLQYATVGYRISHLLWHGYDTSGKAYTVSGQKSLRDMATLHKNLKNSYIGPRSYTNHKGLTANYNMTDLTLNEIWADTKGIDLAWHAYINRNRETPITKPEIYEDGKYCHGGGGSVTSKPARHRLRAIQEPLYSPELDLSSLNMSPEQLYYLQWAQQYCSDTNDLRMLEVMESRQPPDIERVNYVTRMSEGFRKAFQCHL